MYEAFFELRRRPFATTPDPNCWFGPGPIRAALDELVVCTEQGQGIGVLVAPAGAGKTLLCERLLAELSDRFDAVLLRHATFQTRRALLQTLLCELDQPYDRPSDQELRLGLAPVLKRLHHQGRALVLIVDEAHQLSEPLLEELRILADQSLDGQPLVRLILAGQLALEEKLALPGLQALNQRIRAHVCLPTLTQAETRDYIDYRLTWAGGRTDEILTDEALDVIVRACDGLARCVNQLCDHALLLGYVSEERPLSAQTVTEALADLQHLPLPWNSLAVARREQRAEAAAIPALEREDQAVGSAAVLEFGGTDDDSPAAPNGADELPFAADLPSAEAHPEVYRLSASLPDAASTANHVFASATPPEWGTDEPHEPAAGPHDAEGGAFLTEEVVVDRYASLDAGLEPPLVPPTPPSVSSTAPSPLDAAAAASLLDTTTSAGPIERLDVLQAILGSLHHDDATAGDRATRNGRDVESPLLAGPGDPASPEDRFGAAVVDFCAETQAGVVQSLQESLRTPAPPAGYETVSTGSAILEFGGPSTGAAPLSERDDSQAGGQQPARPYRSLFTQLRRKQQGRA